MSPWDSDKSTAADPDNPAADEQLTADEWDAHVADGHFPSDELNFGIDGGDPVVTDPQNGGQVVARYDRGAGSWVFGSVTTDQLNTDVHFVATSDDPQTIANNAGANSTLVFLPGTHTLTLTSTSDGHGLQISNDGVELHLMAGATVRLADNELTSGDTGQLITLANGVSGISITGEGTLDGNRANNTVSGVDFHLLEWGDNVTDVLIEDVSLINSDGNAIHPSASDGNETDNIRIRGVTIRNVGEGIVMGQATDVHIEDFIIENFDKQDGIEPAGGCENWRIVDGTIRDGHSDNHCIDVFATTSNISILGVYVNPGTGGTGGIATSGSIGSSVSDNIKIEDCTVENGGIIVNGPNGTISGNTVLDSPGGGIRTDGESMTVTGNTVKRAQTYGIYVNAPNCTVSGNTSANNDQGANNNVAGVGIGDARCTCTGNATYDDQGTATQDYGIEVISSATEAFVQANHAWGNEDSNIDTSSAPASALVQNNKTS